MVLGCIPSAWPAATLVGLREREFFSVIKDRTGNQPLVNYAYIDSISCQCIACHDTSWSRTNDKYIDMAFQWQHDVETLWKRCGDVKSTIYRRAGINQATSSEFRCLCKRDLRQGLLKKPLDGATLGHRGALDYHDSCLLKINEFPFLGNLTTRKSVPNISITLIIIHRGNVLSRDNWTVVRHTKNQATSRILSLNYTSS